MNDPDEELTYYRAIEDFFAALRGVPHVLSPRDFQLMRGWWREGVPLSAVTSGITEVFARRRERDADDPVVSLSYCRHAVKRAAKSYAEMHVGDHTAPSDAREDGVLEESVARLTAGLRTAADRWREELPQMATVIEGVADEIDQTPEMAVGRLEEHLYSLESAMLSSCWRNLPDDRRRTIEDAAGEAASGTDADDDIRERTRRAVRDSELRRLLGLPRLELG